MSPPGPSSRVMGGMPSLASWRCTVEVRPNSFTFWNHASAFSATMPTSSWRYVAGSSSFRHPSTSVASWAGGWAAW